MQILNYFSKDLAKTRRELFAIKTDDEFIMSEKQKLKKKFKSTPFKDRLSKLFFTSKNRNKDYYVWWDTENEEAKILTYEKK